MTAAGSTALFAVSCFQPAYRHTGWDTYSGFDCLLSGWIFPAWWANPAALTGLILLLARRPASAAVLSAVGAALALTALGVGRPMGVDVGITPYDELLVGYLLWQSSMLVLLAGCLLAWRRSRRVGPGEKPPPDRHLVDELDG